MAIRYLRSRCKPAWVVYLATGVRVSVRVLVFVQWPFHGPFACSCEYPKQDIPILTRLRRHQRGCDVTKM